MTATAMMSKAAKLSESLSEKDDAIAELREQIASFQGSGDLALPADFDIDKATGRLNSLLKDRHAENVQLRELTAKLEAQQQQELARELASLQAQHKTACKAVLAAEIALAKSLENERKPREQAALLTGRTIGPIEHFGPAGPHAFIFDPSDNSSALAHHCREAIKRGIVDKGDEMLKGIAF